MANNAIIGARIKQVREEKGLTQEELANVLGLNKSTIQRYETAKIDKIKLPIIDAIAQKLNVNPEWLSDKTEERTCYATYDTLSETTERELTSNEREMIEIFKDLTETQQGELIGRAKVMWENNRTEAEALEKENAS